MRTLPGILSGLLIAIVLFDAFETIILPRRVTRRFRLTALFYRFTWRPWSAIARRVRKPRRREAYLSYYGPLSTLLLLTVWSAGIILGFAGIHWAIETPLNAPEKVVDFRTYLYMSGTDYFTLGPGDVTTHTGIGRTLTVLEAGLGFGFLAIVIGYFPVLYQAFSKREMNIALLDSRAGSPASALEFLRHYAETQGFDRLDPDLFDAEHWASELLESHISYPVLSYFRSQHDNMSWLSSITTILDACSLLMVGIEGVKTRQAQLTFAMARHAVVDIAQILKTAPRPPEPARLPPSDFRRLRQQLLEAGLNLRDSPEAIERLTALRSRYEPFVNALAQRLIMPLPPWVPDRKVIHNWETSAWGRAGAPSPATPADPVEDDHG